MRQSFRQAVASDLPGVRRLLQDCDLPVDDLQEATLEQFLLCENESGVIGVVGLQVFDNIALLRSLAVAKPARDSGLGNALVDAIMKRAVAVGVTELWLLTTDASGYFLARGFAHCDRDCAPDSIRNTAEFADLCPGDAHLMNLPLTK